MTEWTKKSRRKLSGGLRRSVRRRDKRLSEKGGIASQTKVSENQKTKKLKARGGIKKNKITEANQASIALKGQKTVKASIVKVVENKSNRLYERRNIITKGAIIEVKLGNESKHALVTSRPGKHGTVNAVIVDKIEVKKTSKAKRKPEKKALKTEEKPAEGIEPKV
ncbi:MAG: 30S ribosomal protein S8e [archaeon]